MNRSPTKFSFTMVRRLHMNEDKSKRGHLPKRYKHTTRRLCSVNSAHGSNRWELTAWRDREVLSRDGSPIYSRKYTLTCSNCLKLILVWPYLRHRRCTYCWQTIFTSWLCVCSIGSSRVYNSWKLHWKLSLASRAARTSSKSLRNGSAATRMSCRTELGNRADLQEQSMWSLWAQHMNSNHRADKQLAPWRSGLELLCIKNMRTLSMIMALLLKTGTKRIKVAYQ